LNLKKCTKVDKRYVSLLGYQNSGTIQNFIINFETKLYGTQYLTGGVLYSSGIIQNGYIYGNGIEGVQAELRKGDTRYIAGLAYEVQAGGLIQNIYNLSQITIQHIANTQSLAANIVYSVLMELL